ncbi:hypothetical protein HanXRQr2_Chr16g0755901 [Helianthus annuus]|uniref:Uncharacterized protein n=1 Tax=Helianthus annuus TaxID=4232 RepID=A0A9K3GZ91_HELAN|nr:hypothetical protein HanXRQr2_Chr16g0755901 [Helianthus annuus]
MTTHLSIRCCHRVFSTPRNIMKPNGNKRTIKLSPVKTLEVNLGTLVSMRSRFKRFHRIDTRTDFLSYIFKSRCGYKTYTAVIFAQLQNSFKSLKFYSGASHPSVLLRFDVYI